MFRKHWYCAEGSTAHATGNIEFTFDRIYKGGKGYLILGYDLKRTIVDARGYHCDNVAKRKLQNYVDRDLAKGD
jgi:hypothetical protein